MPAVSEKQAHFMRIAAHASGRKWLKAHGREKMPSVKVAKEFSHTAKK